MEDAVKIDGTAFGSITIDGKTYDHDVVIRLSHEVLKRKKKLSKRVYGTSHTVTGRCGSAALSPEAAAFLKEMGCRVVAAPTPAAIQKFNQCRNPKIGLFHVTR